MPTDKVYCGECRYYRTYNAGIHDKCEHPDNLVEAHTDETYYRRPVQYMSQLTPPCERNKRNSCLWWEAIPG